MKSVEARQEELDAPEAGLLTQEEQDLLRRVERSKVWRLMRDSLCWQRELLFSGNSAIPGLAGQPSNSEALWANRGAILLVQHLLQEGPKLVIWYTRYMVEQQEEKARAKAPVKTPEREYAPGSNGLDERPEFDI